jgi:hypothetical protein
MTRKLRLKRRRTLRRIKGGVKGGGNAVPANAGTSSAIVKTKKPTLTQEQETSKANEISKLKEAQGELETSLGDSKAKLTDEDTQESEKKSIETEIESLKAKIQKHKNKIIELESEISGETPKYVDIEGNPVDLRGEADDTALLIDGQASPQPKDISLDELENFMKVTGDNNKSLALVTLASRPDLTEAIKDVKTLRLKEFITDLTAHQGKDRSKKKDAEKVKKVIADEIGKRDKQRDYFLTLKGKDAKDIYAFFNLADDKEYENTYRGMSRFIPSSIGKGASKEVFIVRVNRAIRHLTKLNKDSYLQLLVKYIMCLIYKCHKRGMSAFDQSPVIEQASYKNLRDTLKLQSGDAMSLDNMIVLIKLKLRCSMAVPTDIRKTQCSKADILELVDSESSKRKLKISPEKMKMLEERIAKGVDITDDNIFSDFTIFLILLTGSDVKLNGAPSSYAAKTSKFFKKIGSVFSKNKDKYVGNREESIVKVNSNRISGNTTGKKNK